MLSFYLNSAHNFQQNFGIFKNTSGWHNNFLLRNGAFFLSNWSICTSVYPTSTQVGETFVVDLNPPLDGLFWRLVHIPSVERLIDVTDTPPRISRVAECPSLYHTSSNYFHAKRLEMLKQMLLSESWQSDSRQSDTS